MNIFTKTLISFSFMTSFAFANPTDTCQNSPHLQVSPLHKKISYGMSKSQVKSKLGASFGPISNFESGLVIRSPKAPYDMIIMAFRDDHLVGVFYSYSNAFQDSVGGPFKTVVLVRDKFKEKFGLPDDATKTDKGVKLTWKANKGALLELTGEDPYKVTYTVKCEQLIDSLDAKARRGANVGF